MFIHIYSVSYNAPYICSSVMQQYILVKRIVNIYHNIGEHIPIVVMSVIVHNKTVCTNFESGNHV